MTITGEDFRHLARAVRIREGETIRVSVADEDTSLGEENYFAEIAAVLDDRIEAFIMEKAPDTECPCDIYLFQAIPKGDRIETIIEKCTELGVKEIIPVEMKYCVVRLDDKKKKKRIERYQTIAETAARQSKRSRVPVIRDVMTFEEALEYASSMDVKLLPYENENGMASLTEALDMVEAGKSVSIMIGPEGGFADEEIAAADRIEGMQRISLGSRILRTDTAAIAAVTAVMLKAEIGRK